MTIYSGFSHQKRWVSIAMLNYQRVKHHWIPFNHRFPIVFLWFLPRSWMIIHNFIAAFELCSQYKPSPKILQEEGLVDDLKAPGFGVGRAHWGEYRRKRSWFYEFYRNLLRIEWGNGIWKNDAVNSCCFPEFWSDGNWIRGIISKWPNISAILRASEW